MNDAFNMVSLIINKEKTTNVESLVSSQSLEKITKKATYIPIHNGMAPGSQNNCQNCKERYRHSCEILLEDVSLLCDISSKILSLTYPQG